MAPVIETVTSGPNGLFSNTYLVDAPDGMIVVDPPMLLSDARAVRTRLLELGRPLAAFIYTHPHPDHVNGATEIRGTAEVPVYATPETDEMSREIDGPKREFWTAIYPEDYPPETTFATVLVKDGAVDIAGLPFTVRDVGAGECATAALWMVGKDAFVGDLVYSNAHPWLFEGRTYAWLEQLERARPLLGGMQLHVGHGVSGGSELIDEQARYILAYQRAIRELSQGATSLSDEAKAELLQRMDQIWPGAALGDLVTMSADAVAVELAIAPAAI
jgi:glyoxylase-like metal-dependent hydrolase (beta-lactamase superfamily II)